MMLALLLMMPELVVNEDLIVAGVGSVDPFDALPDALLHDLRLVLLLPEYECFLVVYGLAPRFGRRPSPRGPSPLLNFYLLLDIFALR